MKLDAAAATLARERHERGCDVLTRIMSEEAAKFLILIDAVRCDREDTKRLKTHLGRCHDHLAKGIYCEAYSWAPATFREWCDAIHRECDTHYLDGPTGYDWVFPNRILSERERALYVDYVCGDEGCLWVKPEELGWAWIGTARDALDVARSLSACGCTSPEALAVVAEIWRPLRFEGDSNWSAVREYNCHTLETLHQRGILHEQPDQVYRQLMDKWLWPLHSIEMSPRAVKVEELRAAQEELLATWLRDQGYGDVPF